MNELMLAIAAEAEYQKEQGGWVIRHIDGTLTPEDDRISRYVFFEIIKWIRRSNKCQQ